MILYYPPIISGESFSATPLRIDKRGSKSWLNRMINEALDSYTGANPDSEKSIKTSSEWYNTLFGSQK